MFKNRFFSISCRALESFKIFPAENPIKNRALVEAIAESKDQKAIFAWHPKKDFPYELTRPLPTKIDQTSSSLLKEKSIQDAAVAFKLNHPEFSRAELVRLTSTSKHRWFPKSRTRKSHYKQTPMDRPYL